MSRPFRLATRGSPLALWQAETVEAELDARFRGTDIELVICKTTGDRNLSDPLSRIGSVGLFTAEVNRAVLENEADAAVHSLKDCPSEMEEGIRLAGVLERSSPFDAFVPADPEATFESLPECAVIATGSLRRRAQLLAARPDLRIEELRGNIATRLERRFSPDIDAIVVAEAALIRLGLDIPHRPFAPDVLLPAVCQGIVGIAVRGEDDRARSMVEAMNHEPSMVRAVAERAFLRVIQGGCRVPAGAHATLDGDTIRVHAMVASLDGGRVVRDEIDGPAAQAEDLGARLGERMIAAGAGAILDEIRKEYS